MSQNRIRQYKLEQNMVFGQLFVKRSLYAIGPLSCLSVCVTLVYCCQMVGWIKIKFGAVVGLGPGHIVLDGDQAPPTERETAAPTFKVYRRRYCLHPYNPWPMSIVAKRLDGSRCHLVRR